MPKILPEKYTSTQFKFINNNQTFFIKQKFAYLYNKTVLTLIFIHS